ncbi:MAG: hypothetical protein ACXW2Y_11495 [Acidimicrobiia bacterium]
MVEPDGPRGMGNMQALNDLIDAPEIHAGVAAGVAALIVGALIAGSLRARGTRSNTTPGIVGPAIVLATLLALAGPGPFEAVWAVPARVVLALAGLWLAGEIASRTSPLIGVAMAVAAGVGLIDPSAHSPGWIIAILVFGPASLGAAAADFDRRANGSGLGPLLLLISIVGLYATVPDTELVLVLLGSAIPVTALAWPRVMARLGSGGAYAAIGLFLWITTVEGTARPGSIIGAAAALGLLAAEPVGRLLASRLTRDQTLRAPISGRVNGGGFVVAQVLLAAYAARVVGRVDDPLVAVALAVPGLAIGVVIGTRAAIGPFEARTRRRRDDTSPN